jgi:hypothetical protein
VASTPVPNVVKFVARAGSSKAVVVGLASSVQLSSSGK